MPTASDSGGGPKIMVFRPTYEEFKDFSKYVAFIESQGAHKAGIAKVIPPPEWKARRDGYNLKKVNLTVPAPICQVVTGEEGTYQQVSVPKPRMSLARYKKMANSYRFRPPRFSNHEEMEKKYWENMTYVSPIYGADVPGSMYDPDQNVWNLKKLRTILDCLEKDYDIEYEGVNTAYLYFGMWATTFPWHTEDMDLYAINYLHYGAPKFWYAIPPEHGRRMEELANRLFQNSEVKCNAPLRHKMSIINPQILKENSIPYDKMVQQPGEFIITFPYGYHSGFNCGFNFAEAINFATPRWVEYGKRASQCSCSPQMVRINMATFVKRFQPDRYDLWIRGEDIGPHPEYPDKVEAAPPPSKSDIIQIEEDPKVLPKEVVASYENHSSTSHSSAINGELEADSKSDVNNEDVEEHFREQARVDSSSQNAVSKRKRKRRTDEDEELAVSTEPPLKKRRLRNRITVPVRNTRSSMRQQQQQELITLSRSRSRVPEPVSEVEEKDCCKDEDLRIVLPPIKVQSASEFSLPTEFFVTTNAKEAQVTKKGSGLKHNVDGQLSTSANTSSASVGKLVRKDNTEASVTRRRPWQSIFKLPKKSASVCSVCGASYKSKRRFKEHVKAHNDNTLRHTCNTCGRMFKHKGYLIEHQHIHTNEAPYRCITCGMSFRQNSGLLKHRFAHIGNPLSCMDCGKSFTSELNLAKHLSKHV